MEFVGNVLFFVSPCLKPRPNDCNILQHHLQAPAERSQNFSTTYRDIVGLKISSAFGHPVATSYDILGIEKRTSAHARLQHCCKKTGLTTTKSYNIHKCCMKNLTIFKFAPTTPNMSQHITTGWRNARACPGATFLQETGLTTTASSNFNKCCIKNVTMLRHVWCC